MTEAPVGAERRRGCSGCRWQMAAGMRNTMGEAPYQSLRHDVRGNRSVVETHCGWDAAWNG